MTQSQHSCENCGAALSRQFDQTRMVTCVHCGSTSVLKDQVFHLAGTGGVIKDAPSMVEIGIRVSILGQSYLPVGQAQFDYGRGWWDEFWCLSDDGTGYWLSVDEGDYALERPLPAPAWPQGFRPRLGAEAKINGIAFRVTEAETATCAAVKGEFPEQLTVGEAHLYTDLSGPDGEIATYERWDGGEAWTIGSWVDPWDVQRS